MWRAFEDRGGERPDWRRIDGGEMRLHRLAGLLLSLGDAEDRVHRHQVLAGRDAALLAQMALDEVRTVGHVFGHVVPAVFLDDGVEKIERGIVVRGIGGDHLAAELRLEEIERGLRHVGGAHELRVVLIRHGDHHHAVERTVLVLEARIDRIEVVGLEREQVAVALPAHEVVQGLEDRGIRDELVVLDLLIDLLVQHVAEAAGDRHLDAGIPLLEDLGQALPLRGRASDIEHEGAFGLGLGVDLVATFGPGRPRHRDSQTECERRGGAPRHGAHDDPPCGIILG